ncbi:hypothetical protein BJX70DRAFT_401448 [Aspergillus crustosus]
MALIRAMQVCTCLLFLLLVTSLSSDNAKTSIPQSSTSHVRRQDATKPFLLRIMPLGASITAGYGPPIENGYRKPLRDQLRFRGWPVNMIGSLVGGDPATFHNRQHEGHKGDVVSMMIANADSSLSRKPNIILINAGTNDANSAHGSTPAEAPQNMRNLLDHLYKEVNNVTVVLSTILGRRDGLNSNVDLINAGYRSIAQEYAAMGRNIVLAEMEDGFLSTTTDYHDNLHPNELGYAKMATIWDQAILVAEQQGLLSQPIDTGIPDTNTDEGGGDGSSTCDPVLGGGRGPVNTQVGSGSDDGPYTHADVARIEVRVGPDRVIDRRDSVVDQLYFAQLVNVNKVDPGQEYDELIYCQELIRDRGMYCWMYLNRDGTFESAAVKLDTGLFCHVGGIRWGDVNGDGLDDFICINGVANMYVAINNGENPPKFEPLLNGGLIRKGDASWAKQDRVRLGDMDGDGRLDYCLINNSGNIYCWRNAGIGLAPTADYGGTWQPLVGGYTFQAQGEKQGIPGVHLVDINGDGRADWVYVYKDGSSKIFINHRGDKDSDGPGLRPHWQRAAREHAALPRVTDQSQIIFGRISGGLGVHDRLIVEDAGTEDMPTYRLSQTLNDGHGGKYVKGDGVFYCDMFGRGWDDYLWVGDRGSIQLYENLQTSPKWSWKDHGVIANLGRDRKTLHFGDWDGDGLCDILAVGRHTGYVEWWRNTWTEGKASPTFDGPRWAVNDGLHLCTEGWGITLNDHGLRFADLDGDGRVDYLCMEKDGRTYAHLNKADEGLVWKDQVKLPPGNHFDRANFHFADVTGDGRADLIWVNKFDATGRVWRNDGFTPASGSSMTWKPLGNRFKGYGRGQNIHFPKLGKLGRADYHDVYPQTAYANTWFNECSRAGEGQDDYPTPIDPNLPEHDGDQTIPRIDLPKDNTDKSFTNLIEKDLIPSADGDNFVYELEDGTNRFVEVVVAGPPVDFPDINCGFNDVGGEDGSTLSCIARDATWLFYELSRMAGIDDGGLRVRSNTQLHEHWQPRGDCETVSCMLMTKAPLHEWVSVGNETRDGKHHEHRFANLGTAIGYRIDQSRPSERDGNDKRQLEFAYDDGGFSTMWWQPQLETLDIVGAWFRLGNRPSPLIDSESIGGYIEQTVALTDVHDLCVGLGVEGQNPYYGALSFGTPEMPEPTLEEIGENLQDCRVYLQRNGDSGSGSIMCYSNMTAFDEDLAQDEEEEDFDPYGPNPWESQAPLVTRDVGLKGFVRSLPFIGRLFGSASDDHPLEVRGRTTGKRRQFKIRDVLQRTGTPRSFSYQTPTYPTGNNGGDLNAEKSNGDRSNYALANPADCTDFTITANANTQLGTAGAEEMNSEHIIEEQTEKQDAEFMQNPQMDLADGRGVVSSGLMPIPYDVLADWGNTEYPDWLTRNLPSNFPVNELPTEGSWLTRHAEALGSSSNPNAMVNFEAALNRMKARIFNTNISPTAESTWNNLMRSPTETNLGRALSLIRGGLSVFVYLNQADNLDLQRDIFRDIVSEARIFQRLGTAAGLQMGSGPEALLTASHRMRATRMQNRFRNYATLRLNQLEGNVTARVLNNQALSQQQRTAGRAAIAKARSLKRQLNSIVQYDANDYIQRP